MIGKRYRFDPSAMVTVMTASTDGSWITRTQIEQRVISRSFDHPFKLALMLHEVGSASALARETGTAAPLAGLGQRPLQAADRAAGDGASVSVHEFVRWASTSQAPRSPAVLSRQPTEGAVMCIEQTLAGFAAELQWADVPALARQVPRHLLMAVAGTGVAGAGEDSIAALRDMLLEAGGTGRACSGSDKGH